MTFDKLIDALLNREGGYVNHKNDRGAATNMGITQRAYSMWRNSHGGAYKDVRGITRTEAKEIYRDRYWNAARCDELPEAVREVYFDAAVNHGVKRAIVLLQAAAEVDEDGVIGGKTLSAVAAMDNRLLTARYIVARYRFYGSIIQRDRSQLVFVAGWMARMAEFN